MTVTPSARRHVAEHADSLATARKQRWIERITRVLESVEPPLSHTELSAGLGLQVAPEGQSGISDIGRYMSTAPRNRFSIPDHVTRALFERLLDGSLRMAVADRVVPGARRDVIVCLPHEADRLGHDHTVVDVAAGTAVRPGDAAGGLDWDDDDLWSGGAVSTPRVSGDHAVQLAAAAVTPRIPAPVRTPRTSPRRWPPRRLTPTGPVIGPVGLGTMRLSTDGRPPRRDAIAVIHAALDLGVRLFDTADAYALDDDDLGHSERLLREAIDTWQGSVARDEIVVATKGGMRRPGGRWVPDTRPASLIAACERSLLALGVDELDLYQLHVIDKRVPLEESLGALMTLRERGLVARIGLCNVRTPDVLDRLPDGHDLAVVQIPVSPFDRATFTSGVLEACVARDLTVLAYAPLGGHKRRHRPGADPVLRRLAAAHDATPEQIALAWAMHLAPQIVPIPGATRVETVTSIAASRGLELTASELAELDARFPFVSRLRETVDGADEPSPPSVQTSRLEISPSLESAVVLVMGSPASGKSTSARPFIEAGFHRLNRDELGGTLAGVAQRLERGLEAGERRFVLDNTYATRKSRRAVLRAAQAWGVPVCALVVDAGLDDTLINAAQRMLERHGRMLSPEELKAASRDDPNMFPPAVLFRHQKIWEPPELDEGFAAIEFRPFRRRRDAATQGGRALLLDYDGTLRGTHSGAPFPSTPDDVAILPRRREVLRRYQAQGYALLGVSNQGGVASGRLDLEVARACFERTNALLELDIDVAFCPHTAGRVACWCRKPMPGLGVVHIARHGLDPSACIVVGDMESDRRFAETLGMTYVEASRFFEDPVAEGG